ncbi:MAG: NAD-dependent epimerase/dehydratase family protein [Thermoanaerobaculia bacterium]
MILVSGGAGVMGARFVKDLAASGHRVRALTLPGDPNAARVNGLQNVDVVFGDVARAETLDGLFEGVDTVFHLAGVILSNDPTIFVRVNTEGTRNMVEASRRARAGHFVFVSSISAVDPISEYARSKAAAEEIVRASGIAWTIVRPTLAYERGGGLEFMGFLNSLLRFPIVPFVGRGRALKNPVHVDDIGKGLLAIAGNPKSHGKTYNFSGGEEISIRDLARLILRHQGVSKPFVHIPLPICRAAAFVMEKTMKNAPLTRYAITRIEQDAAPDNGEARRDLGYDPIGVTEGMKRSYPLAGAGP